MSRNIWVSILLVLILLASIAGERGVKAAESPGTLNPACSNDETGDDQVYRVYYNSLEEIKELPGGVVQAKRPWPLRHDGERL